MTDSFWLWLCDYRSWARADLACTYLNLWAWCNFNDWEGFFCQLLNLAHSKFKAWWDQLIWARPYYRSHFDKLSTIIRYFTWRIVTVTNTICIRYLKNSSKTYLLKIVARLMQTQEAFVRWYLHYEERRCVFCNT